MTKLNFTMGSPGGMNSLFDSGDLSNSLSNESNVSETNKSPLLMLNEESKRRFQKKKKK